jgi:uncharacterized protein (TIGR00730 family)
MPTASATRLCVFCGSNAGDDGAYLETALALGQAMADRGIGLVYGGGEVGLMGAVADGVLAGGGEVIGVIPRSLVDAEIAHPGLTRLEVTDGMHQRKARMAELADGFIALPGGFGTFEETIEVLTWNQLGLLAKPVVLLDVAGFYAPLLDFFDRAVDARFVRVSHRRLAQRAATIEEAIELATAPVPPTKPKWIDRDPS